MRRNIILIMADQLRLDHCGFSGSGIMETPHIDRIAQSVGFTNCQTVNPVCSPARTALLTGKYTRQIGTLAMSGDLSPRHPTFVDALRRNGYATAGIGKFHFLQTWPWGTPRQGGVDLVDLKDRIKEFGFDYIWEASGKQLARQNRCDYVEHLKDRKIFEEYCDFVDAMGANTNYLSSPEAQAGRDGEPWPFEEKDYVDVQIGDHMEEFLLRQDGEAPFFLFGSFCSPHRPYDPPRRYLEMFEEEEVNLTGLEEELALPRLARERIRTCRRAYKALVRLVDDQIGRIFSVLEKKNLLHNTTICFTSDHGDMLGDHGLLQKSSFYKESLNIPLAVRHPPFLENSRNSSPVELTDLAATILDAADIPSTEALSRSWPVFNNIVPCRSLLPLIRGEKAAAREYTFSEWHNNWQCLCTEEYKYVYFLNRTDPDRVQEKLFHRISDPEEARDLSGRPEHRERMEWFRRRRVFTLDRTPPAQLSWAPLMQESSI